MTISVKEAVSKAFEYAHDFYESQEIPHLMLEEVEFDEREESWLITLGYNSSRVIQRETGGSLFSAFSTTPTTEKETIREYKTFYINALDGQFISLKIRKV